MESFFGRNTRLLYKFIKSKVSNSNKNEEVDTNIVDDEVTSMQQLQPCDVLIQVDNFLAGGLENVVLDINKIFNCRRT